VIAVLADAVRMFVAASVAIETRAKFIAGFVVESASLVDMLSLSAVASAELNEIVTFNVAIFVSYLLCKDSN
jgi:hypothetical protein